MALSSALPATASYGEDPQVYVSSATLNLKPSRRTNSLNRSDMLENITFEWHTHVTAPPNTPKTPIVKKTVQQSTNCQEQLERSKDLFLPAFTFNEKDDIPTKMDKFMTCERYHSQYNQLMAKRDTTTQL